MCMQRMGVPRPAVGCLLTMLQEAKHFVRTGFWDSIQSYGSTAWVISIHGIYQGNGAGPAIRAVVSTPLLNILRKKWDNTYEDVKQKLREAVDTWEGCLSPHVEHWRLKKPSGTWWTLNGQADTGDPNCKRDTRLSICQ